MIKAVVMDMDGTLLNSENKITDATLQYLSKLEQQGVRLILASGRSYTRLLPYARQLKMDLFGGWLIEVDGISIYETKEDNRCKYREMDAQEIREVFEWLTHQHAESQAMFDDGLFDFIPEHAWQIKKKLRLKMQVDEDYPWTAGPWNWLTDFRDGYPKITYIQSADEITGKINKIQIMDDEEPLSDLYDRLTEKFGHTFSIYRTTPRQLEILPYGYSKGRALQNLMEEQGWKPEEVAVFGDGENDVSLFKEAKYSFAMANAKDYVKDKASYITLSNNEDGIVYGLKQLLASEGISEKEK